MESNTKELTLKELIDLINKSEITQNGCYEDQEFPESIDSIIQNCEIVDEGLDIDKHRWFETSIVVYRYNYDKYFGIRFITGLFSEMSSYNDIGWTLSAFEMEEVKITSYKTK